LLTPYQLDSNVFTITGYVGYFVLGTFLLSVKIQRSTLAIFIVVGTALTAIGTYLIAWTVGGGEMYYFQEYLSPTMILASVMLFLLLNTYQQPKIPQIQTLLTQKETDPDLQNLHKPNSQSPARKLMKLISENTLPLFLLHVIVLETIQRGYLGFAINGNVINSIIGVPLMTVIVLFVSLGIVLVLKKVPIVKILIG
jgi:surface polysaccharide O-acyltransferase-like enzyme